jgi:hypothetical protein
MSQSEYGQHGRVVVDTETQLGLSLETDQQTEEVYEVLSKVRE